MTSWRRFRNVKRYQHTQKLPRNVEIIKGLLTLNRNTLKRKYIEGVSNSLLLNLSLLAQYYITSQKQNEFSPPKIVSRHETVHTIISRSNTHQSELRDFVGSADRKIRVTRLQRDEVWRGEEFHFVRHATDGAKF